MSKKNEYRFNLRFDETDEDHRKVCQFLNGPMSRFSTS